MIASFISNQRKTSASYVIRTCCIAIMLALTLIGCSSEELTTNDAAIEDSVDNTTNSVQIIEGLANNPIDFAALQAQNPDIYAWLDFPGTDISTPIFQSSPDDMDFYLSHDINGNPSGVGEAYTQFFNTKTFEDPVTLIYGHSIEGTTDAFTNLHRLEDPQNFDQNAYFFIYTPDRILTYEVITVQEIPHDHIFKVESLDTPEGQQIYYDKLLNPTSNINLVRDGVTLVGGESKLVNLITCPVPDKYGTRYMVSGLLVAEQYTK